jgi:hypothetical protein
MKSESDYETILAPVKAHFVKGDCNNILNKLCVIQAFHNNVNLNTLEGITKDPKTHQALVVSLNDRKLVCK